MLRRTCKGVSLTEVLIVVVILGVFAVAATPSLTSTDNRKLDLAASRVAEAIRYARSESIRTGDVYGITISQDTQRVQVRQYDITDDPVAPGAILYHPIDLQPLDFDFDEWHPAIGVRIANTVDPFDYAGIGRRKTVLFDEHGTPMWIVGSGPTIHRLTTGQVDLSIGAGRRVVDLASFTGRVVVQ